MPKRIESPVTRFPGFVVLHDPLTFPQVIAFQDAIEEVRSLENASFQKVYGSILPGIFPCVAEWHLEGVPDMPTMDTFPATPLQSAGELVNWLTEEITVLLREADEVPNE